MQHDAPEGGTAAGRGAEPAAGAAPAAAGPGPEEVAAPGAAGGVPEAPAPPPGSPLHLQALGDALAQAAAGVLGDDEPVAARAAVPEASGADPVTFARACELLGVSPHVLRRLMDDYEELLPPLIEAGRERRLPGAAIGLLGQILRWRNDGLGPEEVLRRVRGAEAAVEGAADEAAPGGVPLEHMLGELAWVHEQLERSEARRAEDRDRLLTALMRTNQELQHLRYEMAGRPRRERRRGFWARIFG